MNPEAAKPQVEVATSRIEPEAASIQGLPPSDIYSPADRYGDLFVAVQSGRVFPDSKTFVDCSPKIDPDQIVGQYHAQRNQPGFDLKAFVLDHFDLDTRHATDYHSDPDQTLIDHIDGLWDVLTRDPATHAGKSSLISLPEPYVVPGGRFGEIYYWDSYFTMLGLAASGRHDLLRSMAANFAYLIDTYGHIPNGNRTYYLSRSQPPVFALMVELFEAEDLQYAVHYLPQLRREHDYWMEDAQKIQPGQACRHVVRLADGTLLNRYWDDRDTPRDESYLEDVESARDSDRPAAEVYRDLRAGAASGWDYSSRWLGESGRMGSIRTTSILPVDLNALLYKLERTIAELSTVSGDAAAAKAFNDRADQRRAAIDTLLWDEASGAYLDFDWRLQSRRELSAATLTPLFVGMASAGQAQAVARVVAGQLLAPGGLATSKLQSGQQWDRPNGWAPLQWIGVLGLHRYGEDTLADTIAARWLHTVAAVYQRDYKLIEKYDLQGATGGGGGEYPLQDGFGWTNGVTRRLLAWYGRHPANSARAGVSVVGTGKQLDGKSR